MVILDMPMPDGCIYEKDDKTEYCYLCDHTDVPYCRFLDDEDAAIGIDERPCYCPISALEQPERKKGKWEKQRETYCSWCCSACKEIVVAMPERMGYPLYDYCPNCGADMREEQK